MEHEKPVEERPDPQAGEKKAPGRDQRPEDPHHKQPQGSKRLTVMFKGVGHGVEVQPGSLASDVLAQVGAVGTAAKLSKSEGPGKGFALTDKVYEHVNDTDTLYVT